MKSCPNTYYVTVIEDTLTGQIVGSATLVVEQKFIHECALVSSVLLLLIIRARLLELRKHLSLKGLLCISSVLTSLLFQQQVSNITLP
jgi:hypothetical protein